MTSEALRGKKYGKLTVFLQNPDFNCPIWNIKPGFSDCDRRVLFPRKFGWCGMGRQFDQDLHEAVFR